MQLSKTIYGLVQAARSWWKKFTDVLRDNFGFVPYENDNCLLKKEKEGKKMFIGLYVDDCLAIGDKDFITATMNEIKQKFQVTQSDQVEEFIGCGIEKTKSEISLHQQDLIDKMKKKFWDKVQKMKIYKTLMGNRKQVRRKEEEGILKLDLDHQKEY